LAHDIKTSAVLAYRSLLLLNISLQFICKTCKLFSQSANKTNNLSMSINTAKRLHRKIMIISLYL